MDLKRVLLAGLVAASVSAVGRAEDLKILSFDPSDSELVFKTPDNGTSAHHYRVEYATSLVSPVWTMVRTVGGVGAAAHATNTVATDADSMFYRIVSTSNSAAYVDGAYMAIDVSAGTNATEYPVSYYSSADSVPGGVTNDLYKTSHILMRRIPKGVFTMGSPTNELGRIAEFEAQRQVTLTKDYYIGVFQVTQKQWERVMGNWPSYFNNTTYRDSRPVELVSYYDIRENPDNSAITPNWPQSSQTHADSFMGKLRAKTGLSTLDLPTEAQWERACRAGTTTALNSGKNLTATDICPNMDQVGRYWYNGGSGYTQNGTTAVGTAKVGSYLPNAWGLHDMHGNVYEWCLDWYEAYHAPTTDPAGAASGSFRVARGGSWDDFAGGCRSAFRYYNAPSNRRLGIGFRLSRTLP